MTGISRLDHVNLRTARLDEMIAWYRDVLGFETGPRPNFSFPGAWLYRDGQALVHLVGVDAPPPDHENLKMEHVAFASSGLATLKAHLDDIGESYRQSRVVDFGLIQIHVQDPEGNHLHIDFDAAEAPED